MIIGTGLQLQDSHLLKAVAAKGSKGGSKHATDKGWLCIHGISHNLTHLQAAAQCQPQQSSLWLFFPDCVA
jgi:hypothetical protein